VRFYRSTRRYISDDSTLPFVSSGEYTKFRLAKTKNVLMSLRVRGTKSTHITRESTSGDRPRGAEIASKCASSPQAVQCQLGWQHCEAIFNGEKILVGVKRRKLCTRQLNSQICGTCNTCHSGGSSASNAEMGSFLDWTSEAEWESRNWECVWTQLASPGILQRIERNWLPYRTI
jgi:hypothetical protein